MKDSTRIRLRGRDYLLRSQGDPEQIQRATRLVEEKLAEQEAAIAVDTHDRFMLAMLNLAGDALRERSERESLALELEQLHAAWQKAEQNLAQRAGLLVAQIERRLAESRQTEGE
ncbi:MAG: cell division protein ZapA [Deltaproteobacteria bacterium]|nr:cell division protein ZapA [Deltaproteobacteria bacterium]NCP03489.1 cell division protein ZapA [Deltaproteobacteria bacterium]